jgi:hypothetical protein
MDSIIWVAVITSLYFARLANHALLQGRYRRIPHLDGEIAPGNHDGVRRIEDLLQGCNRLGALDLREQESLSSSVVHQLAREFHVGAGARKGYGEVVRLEQGGRLDVLLVLLGERRGRKSAAPTVDALVVREHAA